jgi:phage baseplate assembly protein W
MADESVKGTAFPFRIDAESGGVAWTSGRDKLRQNVAVILGTRQGERPMLRDFGTRLQALVHEPADETLSELLKDQAQKALLQWEPRVLVTAAKVVQSEGEVKMQVSYSHLTEPIADELIVPLK